LLKFEQSSQVIVKIGLNLEHRKAHGKYLV